MNAFSPLPVHQCLQAQRACSARWRPSRSIPSSPGSNTRAAKVRVSALPAPHTLILSICCMREVVEALGFFFPNKEASGVLRIRDPGLLHWL